MTKESDTVWEYVVIDGSVLLLLSQGALVSKGFCFWKHIGKGESAILTFPFKEKNHDPSYTKQEDHDGLPDCVIQH